MLMVNHLVGFGAVGQAEGAWQTASDPVPDGVHTGGYGVYTFRIVVGEAEYSTPATATKIRITFKAGSTGTWPVDVVYVGHAAAAGDAYDFESTPTEVKFSGASGFSIAANGTLLSDETTFSFDATKALVISWYQSSSSSYPATDAAKTNYKTYTKSGVNEPATVNVTGYTQNQDGKDCAGIDLIEVFG